MKRIIACISTFLILSVHTIIPVCASQIENSLCSGTTILNRIYELYDLRGELALNIDANYDHIQKIDEELVDLGVQEVSTHMLPTR